jgi:hypothetical protein
MFEKDVFNNKLCGFWLAFWPAASLRVDKFNPNDGALKVISIPNSMCLISSKSIQLFKLYVRNTIDTLFVRFGRLE